MTDSPASVDVYRGPDELRAELIRAALESAGVTVRIYGLRRGASIGAGEQLVDVRVVVPATQRVRAERVLEDLAEAAELAEAAAPGHGDAERAPRLRPRRRLFAVVAALVAPGLGQVYAQHAWSGSLLMMGMLVALSRSYLGMADGSILHGRAFLATLAVGWSLDVTLSQRAITAAREHLPAPERTWQLATGAMQAALVTGLTWILLRGS